MASTGEQQSVHEAKEHALSTRRLFPRMGLIFDFDNTLAPHSIDSLIERLGLDAKAFKEEHVLPRIKNDGWDSITSEFFALVNLSNRDPKRRITREVLAEHGRELKLYEGLPETLDRIEQRVSEVVDDVDVEYYIVSSGVQEIIENITIADRFRWIAASAFHFDEDDGRILWPKRVISHTEKTRYLYAIATDTHQLGGPPGRGPYASGGRMSDEETYLPLNQMIYCGDGITDVPCFALMHEHDGIALGVFKEESAQQWGPPEGLRPDQRVSNLAPADFHEDSELVKSLTLAAERIAKTIALRQQSVDE